MNNGLALGLLKAGVVSKKRFDRAEAKKAGIRREEVLVEKNRRKFAPLTSELQDLNDAARLLGGLNI